MRGCFTKEHPSLLNHAYSYRLNAQTERGSKPLKTPCDSIQICKIASTEKALAYYRGGEEYFAMAACRAQPKSSLPTIFI